MSDSWHRKNQRARDVVRRVFRGTQARAGRLLRFALAVRHVQKRQIVFRSGGGRSSTATYALQRAAEAIRQKNR